MALAGLAACGSEGAGAGCGPIVRETLDPAYVVHVLGTETDVEYRSDPPTSGPHLPAPSVEGALEAPLPRPVQVGLLEQGDVLVQYDPAEVSGEDLADLEGLVADGVVLAPGEDLPAPVVATAWTAKRQCDAVDLDALREFVDERAGKGPEH